MPNEIPVVFHNGSNYNYHFFIKELAKEFEEKFEYLEENTENYKTLSVPIEKKEIKINKNGNENVVTKSYKIKFIDTRFMETLLSSLVDNLIEGIHKIKCKDCDCFLKYESVKDNSIKYKSLSCNHNYSNKIDEELKKRFRNTFKFSDNNISKFILLLRKGVYPYESMDDWERLNKISLPENRIL